MTIYVNVNAKICNDCGKPTSPALDFCQFCGAQPLPAALPTPAPVQPVHVKYRLVAA